MRFRVRRLTGVVLSAAVFCGCLFASPAAEASALTKDEVDSKIAAYEKEAKRIQAEIDALKDEKDSYTAVKEKLAEQIRNAEEQVDLINQQVAALAEEIDAANRKIADKKATMEETKELLKERLCAMYVAGSFNELSILLSAKDFSDFLARAELMRNITDHDTALFDQLKADLTEIEQQKTEVETKKAETDELKDQLEQKRQALDSQYQKNAAILDSLNAQQSDLEAEAAEIAAAKKKAQEEWAEVIANESNSGITYDGKFRGRSRAATISPLLMDGAAADFIPGLTSAAAVRMANPFTPRQTGALSVRHTGTTVTAIT